MQPELVLPYIAETPVIYTTLNTISPSRCANYELFSYGGTAEQLSLITQNNSEHLEKLNFKVMVCSESAQRIMEATAVQDECHRGLNELFEQPKMQQMKPISLTSLARLWLLFLLLVTLAGLVLLGKVYGAARGHSNVVDVIVMEEEEDEEWPTMTIRMHVGCELHVMRQFYEAYHGDVVVARVSALRMY